jgi:hypothetical protein
MTLDDFKPRNTCKPIRCPVRKKDVRVAHIALRPKGASSRLSSLCHLNMPLALWSQAPSPSQGTLVAGQVDQAPVAPAPPAVPAEVVKIGTPGAKTSPRASRIYGYHLAPGVVLSTLFTYTKHPTFAPKLANPITGVVSVTFFF